MSKKRVLWIGFGDLAARTLPKLNPEHFAVNVVSRTEKPYPAGVTQTLCDIKNPPDLFPLLKNEPDYIVVTLTPGQRGREAYRATYVDSISNLVNGIKQIAYTPKNIIFTSSTSVYHQQAGEWVDEGSPTLPTSETAQELLNAENKLRDSGLPHVCVRFSGIYGEGRNYLIRSVVSGKEPGTHWSNRIHADDCASAIQFVIEQTENNKPLPNILLASDEDPVRISDIYAWLASKLGIPVKTPNVIQDENRKRMNKRCDSKMLRELGFTFRYPNYQVGYEGQIATFIREQQQQ